MSLIKKFQEIGKNDAIIAGGKGASLGEMTQAGIPVPSGFVVLSTTFDKFLEETDLTVEIDTILHKVNHQEIHTIENASEAIQALILRADMSVDIAMEIEKYFAELDTKYVAVRSSATAEDSSTAAWAGQLDSFLNTTEKDLLEKVKHCWASLFTPRAIFYRFEKELHETQISVAVVVQKMINSELSGIAFSVHPVTEDYNQLIIEAGFGLGEAIVSGSITPDSYVVEKTPRRIIDINVNVQERGLYRLPQGGNFWQTIAEPQASSQVLNEKQILELSEIILNIERHYGFPCDIEWAHEAGKFYIVQSRPITTLQKERSESSVNDGLTKEILNTKWSHLGKWIEPALAAEVWLEYGSIAQQFFTQRLDKKILYLNGDFFLSQHDSDIFQAEGYEASKKHNKEFFQKIYNVVQAVTEEISNKIETIVSVVSFLEDYKKLTGVWMSLNNIAAGIEKYVQEVNPKAFTMTKGFLNEKPATLQQIDEMNELKEKIEKTIGKKLKKPEEIPTEYSDLVKVHIKKYEWLGTHHFNIGQLTIDNLVQRMQQAKANPTQDSVKEDDTELIYLIWLLDLIGYVRFKAAETSGYTTYYLKKHLITLAKERGLTYEDIVEHTINEISSQNITKEIAEKRKDNTGFYFDGMEHVLSIEQIKDCLDKLLKVEVQNEAELKGLSAQSGKVKGVVKIVIKQDQMKGFENGMVLVAHETTPDIIFAMQKSSAIITDFGGLTSHAAIVARELKKPCIVGTKFATKILKDGDLVEVDADSGTVRIIRPDQSTAKENEIDLFIKISVRDFSLGYVETRYEGIVKLLDLVGINLDPDKIFYFAVNNNGVIISYVDPNILGQVASCLVDKISGDKSFLKYIYQNFEQYAAGLKIFLAKKHLKSEKQLTDFIELFINAGSYYSLLTVLPTIDSLPKKVKDHGLKYRAENDEICDYGDQLIKETIKYLYPKLSGYEKFVSCKKSELKSQPSFIELEKRKKQYIYTNKLITDTDLADFALQNNICFEEDQTTKDSVLKGEIAYRGKVKGKVKVILLKEKLETVEKGDILVSSMTTPLFIPAMKKAAAFVTDEGGITCHAAIVARELKKPCIIGTKIATKVLKDGDLVEVDADSGIVRIIK